MAIEFQCSSCGKVLRVGDKAGGKKAKCPSCSTVLTVPQTTSQTAPQTAPQPPPKKVAQAPPLDSAIPPAAKPRTSSMPPTPRTSKPREDFNPFAAGTSTAISPQRVSRAIADTKIVLRRVDVGSCALMFGAIYAFLGLLLGGFMGLLTLIGGLAGSTGAGGMQALGAGVGGGLFMIILLPLFYGIIGLVGGAILGLIYNLAAHFVGGIKFSTS